ncbi:prepilin-type N-terminal cleavage/methylation domain-containing protein [Neobacillus drentensis]|uniref:type IV pilus modification PilV family protein n=1 Tax=Neobacillus drentensis TaxID=220684 RepID=UPI002FFEB231
MEDRFQSQKGLTLVEVLVSIVLLAIILTCFISLFTQSVLFTKNNDQKLDTMQTAQKIVNLVEIGITKQDLIDNFIINSSEQVIKTPLTKTEIEALIDDTIDPRYDVKMEISKNSSQNLIMFKIIVQDPISAGNKSETYTYIRR